MAQHHRPTSRATVEESRARVAALGGISRITRRISCIGWHLVSCIRRGISCIRRVGAFMFSYDTFGITGCYLVAFQVPSGSQRLRAPITFEALPVVRGASLFFETLFHVGSILALVFSSPKNLRAPSGILLLKECKHFRAGFSQIELFRYLLVICFLIVDV